MAFLILAALIGVPLLEIAVFIQVGGLIGLWPTLGLVVLTAVVGTWQLRAQGLATLTRARGQIDRGVLPTHELFDGLCLLVAGALLLTPGFVTDALGLLLFVAPFREVLRGWVTRHLKAHAQTRVWVDGEEVYRRGPDGTVIDAEFQEVRPDEGADDGRPRRPGELPR